MCESGGKKCSFFEKFGVLCFLVASVMTFAVLPYYRRVKGALSGLRQFLATESPLKMLKNAFYFTSEALKDSEIWSVNRMQHEKHFSRKIMHKMGQRN